MFDRIRRWWTTPREIPEGWEPPTNGWMPPRGGGYRPGLNRRQLEVWPDGKNPLLADDQ